MTTNTLTKEIGVTDPLTTKKTYSSCYLCTANCPITVVSQGGEILSINHPDCVRAEAMQEQRDSDKRLIHPQLRSGPDEPWQIVSRAEAVSRTANKLIELRENHGPESIAFVVGYTKEVRPYLRRLTNVFGSPHYITESSCCFGCTFVAAKLTFGEKYSYFFQTGRFKQAETKCRLVWSNNPAESLIPYDSHHLLTEAGKIPTIVVDPRRTSLAEVATIHLMPRPGTDGALALGLASVILEKKWEDKEFLAGYAHGLEEYKSYVREFTPERTSEITGVPKDKILEAAQLYATSKPAQITVSQEAIVQHSNGLQNYRAVILLAALTGNLDVPGGNKPWPHRLKEKNISLGRENKSKQGITMGEEEFPIFTKNYNEGQAMLLADYIESGRVKAVFSIGTNLMMWPNSKRLEKALRSLEFFSVCDFFPNPTVDAATIFFPAATHLERQALIMGLNGRLQYRPAAVVPRGEANGDTELIFEIAEALGLADEFWSGDIHASYDERLQTTGLSFQDLSPDGKGRLIDLQKVPERGYLINGFDTPSGKVEFSSTALEKAGFDPLPLYREPYWSPRSSPEIAKDFPLVLSSGGRSKNYTHSQGRMLTTLNRREPTPRVQMNPEDAGERGIEDSARVEISSPLGKIEMIAWLTEIVPPGLVHAPHGWAEANINALIPDEGLDPISGYPPFKSSLCQVKAI